ncbi:MAG: sigma-70 family RNA polymerase sigma factor, partial [Anaerolineales bacterium]
MDGSDTLLVAQARAGDRAAFGRLVDRHRPMLLRLALRLLSEPAEAEDVAQEACLTAYLTLDRLQQPERFGAWLAGIGLNLARMRLRRTGAAARNLELAGGRLVEAGRAGVPTPEAVYESRERHTAILAAIGTLPSDQQAAVRLHYFEGLSLSEAGIIAGVPSGTVKARLHRARQRLRAALGEPASPSEMAEAEPMEANMVEVIVEEIVHKAAPAQVVLEAWTAKQLPEAAEPVRQRWTAMGTSEATVLR